MKTNKLLLLLLVAPLSACNFGSSNFSWSSYRNNNFSMNLQSAKFKNYKLVSDDRTSIDVLMNDILNAVENNGSVDKFTKDFATLRGNVSKIANSYIIACTKYYADSNEEYHTKADNLYKMYTSILTFEYDLEEKIYHSSGDIKKEYFGGLTDKQIEERIYGNKEKSLKAEYDAIFTNYQDEGQELYNKYINDYDEEYYLDKGYDYFLRYINKANDLIEKLDNDSYENYLDYSYANDYARDYTIRDAMKFVNFVKQYFVPIVKSRSSLRYPSNIDTDLFYNFSSKNFCYNKTDLSDLFQSYAECLGGKYLEAYNNAFKSGYYCFSDSPNSLTTAYQWQLSGVNDSVLYFSRNYQSILTVIHEFGHYYSCRATSGVRSLDSYDLQETYSQGNEFTFMNYLLDQKKNTSEYETYKFIVDNEFYSNLSQIINEALITEIENFAYTTENLTKESLRAGVEEIIDSYDGTARTTYFMAPCISSPCYYISYATSIMEAMQFYNMDFESAKKNYKKLIEGDGSPRMEERWANANLDSPFEESTFKKIADKAVEIKNNN